MTINDRFLRAGRGRQRGAIGAALAALVLAAGACENPLKFEDPDFVRPSQLEGEGAIATLVQGALGDFTLAFAGAPIGGGATEGIALASGLMADEFILSGTFPTRIEVDTRKILENNATMTGLYAGLQVSRRSAENAADLVTAAGGDASRVLNLAGYTYVFFGENYCSGVPFSSVAEDGTFNFGDPQTTDEIYALALERFNSALSAAQAAGNTQQENTAHLGLARVMLDQGDFANAGTEAAMVPSDFRFELDHSINTARQEDGIYSMMAISRRWTLSPAEGTNGLNFRPDPATKAMDVRVPFVRNPRRIGFDRSTPQYDLLKFPGRDKPTTVGSGVEARLIEAEAALQANQPGTWLGILNDLRANAPDYLSSDHKDALKDEFGIDDSDILDSLPPLSDPGTAAGRVDLHFKERAFWLYSTGTRLSDLRREVRQYGRAANTVFPTGTHFKGQAYGTDVNFPVPFSERNNPNFDGCLDRNP